MMEAVRNGAWAKSGSPIPYLRRVAYLESSGRQYIDTGIVYDPGVNIEIKAMIVAKKSNGCIFGQSYGFAWNASNPAMSLVTTEIDAYFRYGNSSSDIYARAHVGNVEPFTMSYIENELIIGSARTVVSRVESWSSDMESMRLFDRGYKNYSNDAKSIARIYYVKFGDVSRFVPVLDLSGRPAMYDEVSGQLFYNQGTGEFTYGELGAAQ